jgi:hypothetical protein
MKVCGKILLHVLCTLLSISHTFSDLVITVICRKMARAVDEQGLCASACLGVGAVPWHFFERHDVNHKGLYSLFNF